MNTDLKSILDSAYINLFQLETLTELTKNACLEKELSSIYYDTNYDEQINLSKERNNYINMLTIIQDKIANLRKIYCTIENLKVD